MECDNLFRLLETFRISWFSTRNRNILSSLTYKHSVNLRLIPHKKILIGVYTRKVHLPVTPVWCICWLLGMFYLKENLWSIYGCCLTLGRCNAVVRSGIEKCAGIFSCISVWLETRYLLFVLTETLKIMKLRKILSHLPGFCFPSQTITIVLTQLSWCN